MQVDQKRQNTSESAFERSGYKKNRNGTNTGENIQTASTKTKQKQNGNGIEGTLCSRQNRLNTKKTGSRDRDKDARLTLNQRFWWLGLY